MINLVLCFYFIRLYVNVYSMDFFYDLYIVEFLVFIIILVYSRRLINICYKWLYYFIDFYYKFCDINKVNIIFNWKWRIFRLIVCEIIFIRIYSLCYRIGFKFWLCEFWFIVIYCIIFLFIVIFNNSLEFVL